MLVNQDSELLKTETSHRVVVPADHRASSWAVVEQGKLAKVVTLDKELGHYSVETHEVSLDEDAVSLLYEKHFITHFALLHDCLLRHVKHSCQELDHVIDHPTFDDLSL